jgi:hypothetical protein
MASSQGPWQVTPLREDEESTAAGIYGLIVSSAVMAASHAERASAVALGVLVTLVVYWTAERYARLAAERIHDGHWPTRRQLRHQLSSGWEIVTATMLPLAVLGAATLLGAKVSNAVLLALATSTLLLGLGGWEMGRHGQLTTLERLLSAVVAGAFGIAMIVLKAALH